MAHMLSKHMMKAFVFDVLFIKKNKYKIFNQCNQVLMAISCAYYYSTNEIGLLIEQNLAKEK